MVCLHRARLGGVSIVLVFVDISHKTELRIILLYNRIPFLRVVLLLARL